MPILSWISSDFKTESSIIYSILKNENFSINWKPAGYSPPAEKTHDFTMDDNGEYIIGDYFNQTALQKFNPKKEHHTQKNLASIKQSQKNSG